MNSRSNPCRSESEIAEWLVTRIAEITGIPSAKIDADSPLESLGLASREAIGLSGELEEWLDCRLEATLIWDYPTINALARHLGGTAVEAAVSMPCDTAASDPIAIIGMGCRFSGAPDKEAFWQLLLEKRTALGLFPEERHALIGLRGPLSGTLSEPSCAWGGFLEAIDAFDAALFHISPREASMLDPQQRLVLETTWAALQDAGYHPMSLDGSNTGVYIASGAADFAGLFLHDAPSASLHAVLGAMPFAIANRVSYTFGFRGPSLSLDAACASSLYALHLAVQALRSHEIDLAIVGGVNVILNPSLAAPFVQANLLSSNGECRPLDAHASGYVRGEGCGILVLRRSAAAIKQHDHVYALIRGTTACHTGRGNGFSAPSTAGYSAILKAVLAASAVPGAELGYVEMQGAASPLADLMELNALAGVTGGRPANSRPCYTGSCKANIGNTEAASGIAGLIKLALVLRHGLVPPQASFDAPYPDSPIDGFRLAVAKGPVALPSDASPFYGAVISHGLGGAGAAAVLEDARHIYDAPATVKRPASAEPHTLLLSAHTHGVLRTLVCAMAQYLEKNPELDPADVCYTARVSRAGLKHSISVSGKTTAELAAALLGIEWVADDSLPGKMEFRSRVKAGDFAEIQMQEKKDGGTPFFRVPLPVYPFTRDRYWPELAGNLRGSGGGRPTREEPPGGNEAMGDPGHRIRNEAPGARAVIIEQYLLETVSGILRLPPAHIQCEGRLMDYGLDSLLAMDLIARCSRDLQLTLYPRDVFEKPSITQLAQLLAARSSQTGEALGHPHALDFFGWRTDHASTLDPPQKVPGNAPAVFLLSAPRSGSTLLRAMLAGHPRLFCPPELHLLPFNTMSEREKAISQTGLEKGLPRALRALYGLEDTAAMALAERWREDNMPVWEVYRQLQERAAPRVLVDKSPTYAAAREILARAEEMFESPRYVFLMRHPFAVIESFVHSGMERYLATRADDPYATAEIVWAVCNYNLHLFLEKIPVARKHRVRFEDLTAEPEKTLEGICAFLGVPFAPEILEPYQGDRMTDGVLGDKVSVGDPNFLNHSTLEPELGAVWRQIALPRPLSPATTRLAEGLGYEVPLETATAFSAGFEEGRL